ncbi:ComEA family DNA-binding protein [Sphingobacterium cellulitidis]
MVLLKYPITLLLTLIITFHFSTTLYAQSQHDIDDILASQILDETESSHNISEYAEILTQLKRRPLDLNKATEQDFRQLIFLSELQIQQILSHRNKIKSFISTLELQVIPGINAEVYDQLLPFIKVKDDLLEAKSTIPKMMKESSGSWMLTYSRGLQVPRGYEISDPKRSRYLGSPDRLINRLRWNWSERVKFALNMKKDPGEPFFNEKQTQGFDHYSGSISIRKIGRFENIILGDYLLQFGQGLALWNGPVFGKGASVAHIMQNGLGLKPHTGLMESKYMRGMAAQLRIKNLSFTPFLAYNHLSASINAKGHRSFVSSINYSGLHRTPSELKNRHSLQQLVYGVNVGFQPEKFKVGFNFLTTRFDRYLKLNNRDYSRYRFEGNILHNVSLYYQYNLYNLLAFGESAYSIGAGWANNQGLIAGLGRKFSASLAYRNYGKDYHSFFGQSFQEQSNLANEIGWSASIAYHPNRNIEWINKLDYVQFPWLKFRTSSPSNSVHGQSQLSYIWYKKGHLKLRYQYKFYQENYPSHIKTVNPIADLARQQARISFFYKLNRNLQIGNQVEGKQFHKSMFAKQYGFLVFQDLIWNKPSWKMGGNLRFAYFNADSYDARLFAYERDVLYSFSFPSYFRNGFRFYLNQKIKPIKGIDIWFRYAITTYRNLKEFGSGLDKIIGNNKSDLRFQIRYAW